MRRTQAFCLAMATAVIPLSAARADLAGGFTTFTDASLSLPYGVATDAAHNIYIVNSGTHQVDIFDGITHDHTGTFGTASLTFPSDIVRTSTGWYVSDSTKIQKFDLQGNPGISFGTLTSGKSISADAASNIYVADSQGKKIQKFDANGQLLLTLTSANGLDFSSPWGVAADPAGNFVVGDSFNDRMVFFDAAGNYVRSFSTVIPGWGDHHPKDLLIAPDGSIYATIGDPGFVHFASDGTVLDKMNGFTLATGLALDGNTLYATARGLGGSNRLVAIFTVPEPSSLALAACAAALLLRHPRRRSA